MGTSSRPTEPSVFLFSGVTVSYLLSIQMYCPLATVWLSVDALAPHIIERTGAHRHDCLPSLAPILWTCYISAFIFNASLLTHRGHVPSPSEAGLATRALHPVPSRLFKDVNPSVMSSVLPHQHLPLHWYIPINTQTIPGSCFFTKPFLEPHPISPSPHILRRVSPSSSSPPIILSEPKPKDLCFSEPQASREVLQGLRQETRDWVPATLSAASAEVCSFVPIDLIQLDSARISV